MNPRTAVGPVLVVALCSGCITEMAAPGVDGGAVDAGPPDLRGDVPDQAGGGPDLAVAGTLLARGKFELMDVTSDGYAIVHDYTHTDVFPFPVRAVPIAGGGAVTLHEAGFGSQIEGSVAFVGAEPAGGGSGIDLVVFHGGKSAVVAHNILGGATYAASDDGARVYFPDTFDKGTSSFDLVMAAPDGGKAVRIGRNHLVKNGYGCFPWARFTAGGQLMVAWCDQDGQVDNRIDLVDADGHVTPVAAGALSLPEAPDVRFRLDEPRVHAFAVDPQQHGLLWTAGGGPAAAFDSDVADGAFSPDGKLLYYRTGAGALKRMATAGNDPPVVLVASGVHYLPRWFTDAENLRNLSHDGVSPDGKWILVSGTERFAAGFDLSVASTQTPGAPRKVAVTEDSLLFGEPFTADSGAVVYFAHSMSLGKGIVGALTVSPHAGSPVTIGTDAFLAYRAADGRFVWNDGFRPATDRGGYADLRVADPTDPRSSRLLVAGAEGRFAFDHDRKRLVFSLTDEGQEQGVYVTDLR